MGASRKAIFNIPRGDFGNDLVVLSRGDGEMETIQGDSETVTRAKNRAINNSFIITLKLY